MMRQLGLCVAAFLLVSGFAIAEEAQENRWTTQDTAIELVYLGLWLTDWRQTLEIADNPAQYYEAGNRIAFGSSDGLGRHPSRARVNKHFAIGAILHPIVAYYLPRNARNLFLAGTIGYEARLVYANRALGLNVGIRF